MMISVLEGALSIVLIMMFIFGLFALAFDD